MPLPSSGPIGADDINEDIGASVGSQVDIDQIAVQVYSLSRPHSFNEFYGLGATGAENIDLITSTYLASEGGEVIQISNNVRSDGQYDIVVSFAVDTELQWATGFIYSVIVLGTLGQYPNAEWTKDYEEDAVPFTGPFNSYRTLTVGVFPNDIGNGRRIGYVNFVGSNSGRFTITQEANYFWATINNGSSASMTFSQGSTSQQTESYSLTAGPYSYSGGHNPNFFSLTSTNAPTGEVASEWLEGRFQKLVDQGYTTWYNLSSTIAILTSFGPSDTINLRPKQVNNTYHDIVFTVYFNAQLVDREQEGVWLNRLPLTVTLEGLPFTFNMTPSPTSLPRTGGTVTITFSLSSGTWSSLSANKSWVSFNKTSGNASDTATMTVGTNPEITPQTITVTAVSSVTGETQSFTVSQAGLPSFTSSDISISGFSVSGQTGAVVNPTVTITNGYSYTISYSSGYNSSTNTYPTVSSATTRTVTVSVSVPDDGNWGNANATVSKGATYQQAAYVVPQTITVDSVSPTSLGTFIGASTAITVTSSTSFTANLFSYGFKFSNSQGLGVTRNSDTSISGTTGTRTVYVETTVDNSSGASVRNGQVNFYTDTGGGTDTAAFEQEGQPTFDSSDWTGGVSISSTTGNVSISTGNSTTTPSVSPTSFPTRTTSTPNRTVTVSNVTAPSGWSNSGTTLSPFNLSVTQAALPRTLDFTASSTSVAGNVQSVQLFVNDVYYTNTSWNIITESTNLDNPQVDPTSGTGDSGIIFLTFGNNTSGSPRSGTFRLNGGDNSPTITITQATYVAPPSISITSVSPAGPYPYEGQGNIFVNISRSGGTNYSAQIAPSFNSVVAVFPSLQPSGITWNNASSLTITTGTSFYVEVPSRSDGTLDTYSSQLFVNASNSGGNTSDSYTLEQVGLVNWETNPTSLSFGTLGGSENITLNSSYSWTASVSGTGFSIDTTSGNSGTSTISVTATQKDLGGSGTLTFSASGQSDIVVSLSQVAAPLEILYYINGSSSGQSSGTFTDNSISYVGESTSVGVYAYRGSTPQSTSFILSKNSGGAYFGVSTTTSGTNTTVSSNTTQSTGASAATLYINFNSNSGNTSTRSGEVQLECGGNIVTFNLTQNSDPNAGSGGKTPPGPGGGEL